MSRQPEIIDDDDDLPKRESRASRRFQILEAQGLIVGKTLGNGSYACVKSAYDMSRKCKVALKIISKRKAPDDYLIKFLPREIEIVRIMRHPNLIQFYQVIETTTRFFLVMEISENGDLLDHIRKLKTISEEQAGKWMRNLIDGIMYMHSKNIVHRDLKCENLLVDTSNVLKVTDFGFGKRVIKGKNNEFSLSETYCGSYAYAPPEILKGTPYNPFSAEVWSIGVVLFTMVYGRLPFDDSDHKRLLKQVQAKVMFPSKPEVSEICRILVLKMLTKSSDRIPLGNTRFDAWYKCYCLLPEEAKSKEETEETSSMPKIELPSVVDMSDVIPGLEVKPGLSNVSCRDVDLTSKTDKTVATMKALGDMLSPDGCLGQTSPKQIMSDDSIT